ncbi:hypothetical protein F5B20DRAFT_487885 [Whalleya microplaca]|nr:hypothetical protein F5B20DRAFT_487885 [Whalleya microplaca]
MPPKAFFLEYGKRDFICRACLLNLRKRTPPAPWPVRYSSQAAQAAQATQATRAPHASISSTSNATPPSTEREVDEAERRKTLEALGLLRESKDEVLVNYFEQGKRGDLRRLQSADEFSRSMMGGEAESRLRDLEQQLEKATHFTKIVEDIWGKQGAEKMRRRFLSEKELPTTRSELVLPVDEWKEGAHRDLVAKLNNMIKTAGFKVRRGVLNHSRTSALWKYYSSARPALSGRWELVPPDTWDLLWQVLAADHKYNTNRMSHVHILAKDMQEAGVALRDDQQLLAIEATFISGFREEAIKKHRRLVTTLGDKAETFSEFWQLGLRMYCQTGDIARAERVVNTLFESPHESDPRFLFPYIRMCAGNPTSAEKGYESYHRLRSALGDSITIDDYDQIISYFLSSNETEFALYIFVEMMTSRTIDARGTRKLPPSVANTFFLGKWLKRLIGAGDLNGAYNVLLHMKERGVMPQSIQINGLIGAWIRSGAADNVQKAEDVAWSMINARFQFVQIREDMSQLYSFIRLRQYGEGWPRANLETFSLLAENYKERGLHGKMEELWRAFRRAKIAPDSFMLNQLLFSYLGDGQGEHVASTSKMLTNEFNVEPDPATFMALWQSLPVNRLVQLSPDELVKEIPRTRSLFAEMVGFSGIFAAEGVHVHLAGRILHSFRKLEDKAGLLVAYRALRQLFNFKPPEILTLELLVGSDNLERMAKSKAGHRLMHVAQHVENYLSRRQQELIAAGQLSQDDQLSPEIKREELSRFLELRLQSEISKLAEEGLEQSLTRAALEMGLPTGNEAPDDEANR